MKKTMILLGLMLLVVLASVSAREGVKYDKDRYADYSANRTCDYTMPATPYRQAKTFENAGVKAWDGECIIPRKSKAKVAHKTTDSASVVTPPVVVPPVVTCASEIQTVCTRLRFNGSCGLFRDFTETVCTGETMSVNCGPWTPFGIFQIRTCSSSVD